MMSPRNVARAGATWMPTSAIKHLHDKRRRIHFLRVLDVIPRGPRHLEHVAERGIAPAEARQGLVNPRIDAPVSPDPMVNEVVDDLTDYHVVACADI